MARIASFVFPLLGAGFTVAGLGKVVQQRPYRRLARHWIWSNEAMQGLGAAELAGGALMLVPATRRFGGAVLTGASVVALASELRHHDTSLALPRSGLLLGSIAAVLIGGRQPNRRRLPAVAARVARSRPAQAR